MDGIRSTGELLAFIAGGGRPKYLMFWGHQPPPGGGVGRSCLSQWWPVTFTADGVRYASAEHYMMRAKALLFGDTETAGRIEAAPHPGAAKALGREVRGFDEERWAAERFGIVVDANMAKFGQHAELREFLTGTGDRGPGHRGGVSAGPGVGHRAGGGRRPGPVTGTLGGPEPAWLRADGDPPQAAGARLGSRCGVRMGGGGWLPRSG
jgi:hypothetical protein